MDPFSRYIEYVKHNPEGYWFKRKIFGWGWIPAKWEGWVMLAIFVAILLWQVVKFSSLTVPSDSETKWFVVKVFAWALTLILVCYAKGEPPKWQWGIPEHD